MLSKDSTEEDMRVPEWKLYKYRVGYFGKKYEDLVAKGEDMSHYVRLAKEQDYLQAIWLTLILKLMMLVLIWDELALIPKPKAN